MELPWRELAQQLHGELAGASIADDDLYETIGDWLTTFQKIYAVFFVDLYALVDGDNPFYATKLDSVNVGLPKDIAGQYIQPLMEILQRVQKERIDAFNEELRRQKQEEEEQKCQEELQKQRTEETQQEAERQRLASFKSASGMESEYQKLDALLADQKWREADELTTEIMLKVANRPSGTFLNEASIKTFPCEDLQIIDRLWVHNSNGKFGFSIQKDLWLTCGGNIKMHQYRVFERFAANVGWHRLHIYKKKGWLTYGEFLYKTQDGQNAAHASFPNHVVNTYSNPKKKLLEWAWWDGLSSLMQRLIECNI